MADESDPQRADRERAAYDDGAVWATNHAWHARGRHVFECPNTLRHERMFSDLAARYATGRRVLDIGCGFGESSQALLAMGAAYVRGVDVSTKAIGEASRHAIPGRLEFQCTDVGVPVSDRFDLISGRSILHHIDYRPVFTRLFEQNLSPGGAMLFMEPLGDSLVNVIYRAVAPSAHTADERSFTRDDLRWFRRMHGGAAFHPYNYLSYPVGVVSTLVADSADNACLRLCDRVDTWLARNVPWLASRFRGTIIVVEKPARA